MTFWTNSKGKVGEEHEHYLHFSLGDMKKNIIIIFFVGQKNAMSFDSWHKCEKFIYHHSPSPHHKCLYQKSWWQLRRVIEKLLAHSTHTHTSPCAFEIFRSSWISINQQRFFSAFHQFLFCPAVYLKNMSKFLFFFVTHTSLINHNRRSHRKLWLSP